MEAVKIETGIGILGGCIEIGTGIGRDRDGIGTKNRIGGQVRELGPPNLNLQH